MIMCVNKTSSDKFLTPASHFRMWNHLTIRNNREKSIFPLMTSSFHHHHWITYLAQVARSGPGVVYGSRYRKNSIIDNNWISLPFVPRSLVYSLWMISTGVPHHKDPSSPVVGGHRASHSWIDGYITVLVMVPIRFDDQSSQNLFINYNQGAIINFVLSW